MGKIGKGWFFLVLILLVVCIIVILYLMGFLESIINLLPFTITPKGSSQPQQQQSTTLACGNGHIEIGEECEHDSDCKSYEKCVNCFCEEKINITSGQCSDSDGINDNEVGLCVDSNGRFEDYCSDWNMVYEYSCSPDNTYCIASEIKCMGDCIKGVCTSTSNPSCSDTDGGDDLTYKGKCVDRGSGAEDNCISSTMIIEYSCGSSGSCQRNMVNCPSGTTCSNGACV